PLASKIRTNGWEALATNYGALTVMFLVGFALQMLFGALSHLIPVVIGGGPRPVKAGIAELNRLGTWRVCTTNLAIGLCLLPVPSLVRVIVSSIALIALASTLVLILRAIFVMIRTKLTLHSPPSPATSGNTPATRAPKFALSHFIASVIVVALGAGLGIGLDPSAAGWNTSPGSSGDVEPTGEVTRVEVTMATMRFTPESIDVPAGNELIIELTNYDASGVNYFILENG